MKKYKGRKVFCVDSLNACLGEGILAIKAAEYRDMGLNANGIKEEIKSIRTTVNQFCTVHSLDALRRSGRVKATSAFFGNLLGVKPIIISNKYGNNEPIKKVRGRFKSMLEIVDLMATNMTDPENQVLYICHSDADDVAELEKMVRVKLPDVETYTCCIGPIIGASIGPDALALFAFGQNVTMLEL